MSTLLAGYDLVLEVSKDALLNLARSQMRIGGEAMDPPFEVFLPFEGGTGSAHLIITALDLKMAAEQLIALTLTFECGSVDVTAPIPANRSGIAGSITVEASVVLTTRTPTDLWTQRLAIDFTNAAVELNAPALTGTPDEFLARVSIQSYIRTLGVQSFPPDLSMVPRNFVDLTPVGNGSLDPLRFVSLRPYRINDETLGLFGILLAANDGKGDPAGKAGTAISAGNNACVSVSPEVFHSLIFCPTVTRSMGKRVEEMSPSCGAAGGFNYRGVTLTRIADGFAAGYIFVDIGLTTSGDCYTATARARMRMALSIEQGKLVPALTAEKPDIEVSMPWYCHLAMALLTGPIGALVIEIVEGVAEDVAHSIINQSLSGISGESLTIGLPSLIGSSVRAVSVTAEGLTFQGVIPRISRSVWWPGIRLDGSVTTSSAIILSTGIFKARIPCKRTGTIIEREFPYIERSQQQSGTYTAEPTLLCRPVKLDWWLETGYGGSPKVPLDAPEGTARIPVEMTFSFPLGSSTSIDGEAAVQYRLNEATVRLYNDPAQGNFRVVLHVRATVPDKDHTYEDSIEVLFEGNPVDVEGGYQEAVTFCMLPPLTIPKREFDWPAIDFPAQRRVFDFVTDVIGSNDPARDLILAHTKLAHGRSFHRAIGPRVTPRVPAVLPQAPTSL